MKPYLLLTPGPLTTSETVKEAMMTDWCTLGRRLQPRHCSGTPQRPG